MEDNKKNSNKHSVTYYQKNKDKVLKRIRNYRDKHELGKKYLLIMQKYDPAVEVNYTNLLKNGMTDLELTNMLNLVNKNPKLLLLLLKSLRIKNMDLFELNDDS